MMAQQRRSTMGPVMGVTRLMGYSPGVPPPVIALVRVSFDLLLLLMDRISQMKLRRLCDEVEVAARTGRKEKPHNHSQMPDLNP
ncbi:hypothetical protein PAHAL_7G005600 [Panicum hallii]|uniref:Uncharacterized protein n=1 Tax=Panicum hallii TaxID=206008 RepID=A0A2T8IAL6_9POAL|nr:hypothetical protein PAHAL_7G005600 [Panicum hallii]